MVKRRKGVLRIKRAYSGYWTWELMQSNGKSLIPESQPYSSKRNAVKAVDKLRDMLSATFFTVRVEE